MLNFDIKRTTRKCAATDRPFAPGEEFISALLTEGEELVRRDYSLEGWQSPPENCIGWWKGQVPELDSGRVYWAPNDVLLSYFQKILELPGHEPTTFVMALLLVQKRILKIQDSGDDGVIHLFHNKSRSEYEVTMVELTPEQKTEIQEELAMQLFTDRAPDGGSDGDGNETHE